mmetsp:Transcript_11445/g.12992  ORF Transcript_11445/g.12992 Transcript_11445/m.12992 type:complete len:124 (-) Transcript_11445:181-552(-)
MTLEDRRRLDTLAMTYTSQKFNIGKSFRDGNTFLSKLDITYEKFKTQSDSRFKRTSRKRKVDSLKNRMNMDLERNNKHQLSNDTNVHFKSVLHEETKHEGLEKHDDASSFDNLYIEHENNNKF